jgi:hypothetical protein
VKFREGAVSYHTAAHILRCRYQTIASLVASGHLAGGTIRGKQRSRWVTFASVQKLHRVKLRQQAATYEAARKYLEGVVP